MDERYMLHVTSSVSGYDLLNISTQKTQFGLTRVRCAEIIGRSRTMIHRGFVDPKRWPFLRIPPRLEDSHKGWLLRETTTQLTWPTSLDDPRIRVLVKARFNLKLRSNDHMSESMDRTMRYENV